MIVGGWGVLSLEFDSRIIIGKSVDIVSGEEASSCNGKILFYNPLIFHRLVFFFLVWMRAPRIEDEEADGDLMTLRVITRAYGRMDCKGGCGINKSQSMRLALDRVPTQHWK